jgi:uncharacterized protein (TIGR02246 family)
MHTLVRHTTALVLLLVAWALPCHAADVGAHALDTAWVKAMKANDLEAIMKCYAPDAVAWLPDMREARGEQAIRAAYQAILSKNTVKDTALTEAKYKTAGTTSVGWGKYMITLVPKAGGNPIVMTGRYNEVAERRGGRWVLIVDHASAEPTGTESAKQ